MTRTCHNCGGAFETRSRRIYCSSFCQRLAGEARRRVAKDEKLRLALEALAQAKADEVANIENAGREWHRGARLYQDCPFAAGRIKFEPGERQPDPVYGF